MESLPQACLDATLVATARVLTADHLSGKYFHTLSYVKGVSWPNNSHH